MHILKYLTIEPYSFINKAGVRILTSIFARIRGIVFGVGSLRGTGDIASVFGVIKVGIVIVGGDIRCI